VARGEVGVRAQTITPLMAQGLGLSRDWGVVLADVLPGGPAEAAGLEIGDIVLALDGKPMENGRQLAVNVYQRRVSDRVRLQVLRGGEALAFEVEVVERRDSPSRFAGMVHPDRNLVPELGILGIDLDAELARWFTGLRVARGVIVAARAVEARAPEGEGLMPGDVIHRVNGLTVASLSELKAAIARYRAGDPLALLVERGSELRFVVVTLDGAITR
jgi:serine protease Do